MPDSIIRRAPLFASLPPGALDALAAGATRAFAPGQVLFREGERGDSFLVIMGGEIEIVKALGSPAERVLGVHGAGEFVGEMSLINPDGLRTASTRARAAGAALEVTRADFEALLQRHPALATEMLRVLSTRLRESNDSTIADLREKNERLARAYEELQDAQARIIEQETLLRELRLAREIQQSMLPRSLPPLPGFDIDARMIPAHMVGGDFFDVVDLGAGRLGVAVGDVSGKGMPAALFMALASSLLRAEMLRGAPPAEALAALNHHLTLRNLSGMFVTLLYGVLDSRSRQFSYARAGHEYPLVWDSAGPLTLPHGRGHPLGLLASPALDEQAVELPPGRGLLLYTDGATDVVDEAGAMLGTSALPALAGGFAGRAARDVCDQVIAAVAGHQGRAPQFDDITLVAICAA